MHVLYVCVGTVYIHGFSKIYMSVKNICLFIWPPFHMTVVGSGGARRKCNWNERKSTAIRVGQKAQSTEGVRRGR